MKKLIRLTESDLHRIVKESVNSIMKDYAGPPSKEEIAFFKFIHNGNVTPIQCSKAGVDYDLLKKYRYLMRHSYSNGTEDPAPLENEIKKQFIANYRRLQKQGWLKEGFGTDFEDTLRWVQNKKPNMSPEEQKQFAQNIINKQKGETVIQDGEYQMAYPKDNDEWWIIHIRYGFGGGKEKHYTVYSEEKAKEIIAKWDKWESEKKPRYHYHYECYHVENPNHSSNRNDWYYEHWNPYD